MTGVIVDVDPTGEGAEWMFVVIQSRTGVRYWHQYGGTACLQGYPEGYLVPVFGASARTDLDSVFLDELGGAGVPAHLLRLESRPQSTSPRDRLTTILAGIHIGLAEARSWDPVGSAHSTLRLDDSRIDELNQAWVPVLTPAGTGTLIWPNSD